MVYIFRNANNITYHDCLVHSRIFMDSFRTDVALRSLCPTLFVEGRVKPSLVKKSTKALAQLAMLKVLRGEAVLCNMVDEDEEVATSYWYLPEDQKARISLFQHLKYWAYKIVFTAQMVLDHLFETSPFTSKQFKEFFHRLHAHGGAHGTAEQYEKLAHMSWHELSGTLYPLKDTLYLHILAVRGGTQGRGYGGKLLNYVIENKMKGIKPAEFRWGDARAVGPAKVSLYASPFRESFYLRHKFVTMRSWSTTLDDGTEVNMPFMERLIDPNEGSMA